MCVIIYDGPSLRGGLFLYREMCVVVINLQIKLGENKCSLDWQNFWIWRYFQGLVGMIIYR